LVADAIHRQLTDRPVLVEGDRVALITYIARNQMFAVESGSTDFNFIARNKITRIQPELYGSNFNSRTQTTSAEAKKGVG